MPILQRSKILKDGAEEIALSLAGKKKNLDRKALVDYFGKEKCLLTEKVIDNTLQALAQAKKSWYSYIDTCFLSNDFKKKYILLLEKRMKILSL